MEQEVFGIFPILGTIRDVFRRPSTRRQFSKLEADHNRNLKSRTKPIFFKLPQELRDLIWTQVLLAEPFNFWICVRPDAKRIVRRTLLPAHTQFAVPALLASAQMREEMLEERKLVRPQSSKTRLYRYLRFDTGSSSRGVMKTGPYIKIWGEVLEDTEAANLWTGLCVHIVFVRKALGFLIWLNTTGPVNLELSARWSKAFRELIMMFLADRGASVIKRTSCEAELAAYLRGHLRRHKHVSCGRVRFYSG